MVEMIHRELCKRFKFNYTNKWYLHKSEFVIENETHEILLDLEIQTDHSISTRRPDLESIHLKKCHLGIFAVLDDY